MVENNWHRTYGAYLFDLDGTLVDTVPDIHIALNHTLMRHGFDEVDVSLTRHWIGHGVRALVNESLIYHKQSQSVGLEDMVATFLGYYANHLSAYSAPYEGVLTTLNELRNRGSQLAVVTNKLTALSVPLLEQLKMADWFDTVVCGDSAAKPKPAPDPVDLCLDRLEVSKDNALFVGDSDTDVKAAQAAKIPVVCMRDGYNHGINVETLGADAVIDYFGELL
ncbi:MAG: HAD-IA family hydrolase [Pseudomonadales bacterium]|nr:HAD-IA family hydrolase [Pseudomonadales bacterium]